MALLGAIETAGSGMTLARKWMDAVGDNLSNMDNAVRPSEQAFRQRYIVAQATNYDSQYDGERNGVQVAGVQFGSGQGRLVQDPTSPLADAEGYVRMPDIDMASQMGQLIISQRAYQANAAVVDRAKTSYEAALQIGRA